MIAALLTVLLGFVQVASSGEEDIEVRVSLAPDTARVGERTWLTVSVSGVAEADEIHFPELPDTGSVVGLGVPRVLHDRSAGTRSARYELAAWQIGDLELPLGDVRVTRGATEILLPLASVRLHVVSVLPADAALDGLAWRPPADVVGPNWSLAERLAAALLALALVLGLLAYLRRRGAAQPPPREPPRPPRERAFDALAALRAGGLLAAGEFKAFYSHLSRIVRSFLAEMAPGWRLDLTTRELMSVAQSGGLSETEALVLGGLLGGADMVKFARRRPTRSEAEAALETARRWIASFQPVVVQAPSREQPIEKPEGGGEALTALDAIFAESAGQGTEETAR
ncbi:MAG: hypothetical protein JSU87_00140 [Gemmatimonadota bacterium]|nr:MAG: hypothetical protein JSU87_00140 [Gemmatimonadota bacterium]